MSETFGAKLRDFAGYTSIHGFGRIADSVFVLRKVFWICALSASFGMCVFQIYRLSLQFISEGVNTKVSVTFKELEFPAVTICNLNPLKLSDVLQKPELFQILNETDNAFDIGINYPYPKTSLPYAIPYDTDNDNDNDDEGNDNDNDDDDNDDNDNDDEDNDNVNDDEDNNNDNDDEGYKSSPDDQKELHTNMTKSLYHSMD
ncbi:Hypothetical predicted protein [Mytilus galloprovincialis]|uniref:Uncharacterized protein n=1 Tax=Mytilus galloprovincialis TaxID=29158 RepID=A0A8B6FRH2_MYTGA|nr:Hypothetical predicted protein [Mytilus galloprovincialis]